MIGAFYPENETLTAQATPKGVSVPVPNAGIIQRTARIWNATDGMIRVGFEGTAHMPMPAGAVEIFALPSNVQSVMVAATDSGTVEITIGRMV